MSDRSKWTPHGGERVTMMRAGYPFLVTVISVFGRGANRQVRYILNGDKSGGGPRYIGIVRFRNLVEQADSEATPT